MLIGVAAFVLVHLALHILNHDPILNRPELAPLSLRSSLGSQRLQNSSATDIMSAICSNNSSQLPLCNLMSAQEGDWVFGINIIQPSFSSCPNVRKNLKGLVSASSNTYSANSFQRACWKPAESSHCRVLGLEESTLPLRTWLDGRRVLMIGDMVGMQNYIGLHCALEELFSYEAISIESRFDATLVTGVLCSQSCSNETFFQQQIKLDSHGKCSQCSRTRRIEWFQDVTADVGVLVLNTGKEYLPSRGVDDPEAAFRSSLLLLRPVLRVLLKRGVIVVWTCLPSASFSSFNLIAKDILQPVGVIIIDVAAILEKRKAVDKRVSYVDGLMMANPAETSNCELTAAFIFHSVTLQIEQQYQNEYNKS